MHALIFLFMALTALFVGASGSPFNGDVASNLADMGSFVGGFFTPILTVGAVWVAYRQLKDERKIQHEKAEINYFSLMAKNHLNQARKSYDTFNKGQKEEEKNLKKIINDQIRSKNNDLIYSRYSLNGDITEQINLAAKTILEIRHYYQKSKKIAVTSENLRHELHVDYIAKEEIFKAKDETRELLHDFLYLKYLFNNLLEKEPPGFQFKSDKFLFSQALIALQDPDKE